MTPDELWEKYKYNIGYDSTYTISKTDFLAALAEYGELVKAEAVKVCENIGKDIVCPEECAAAIEKMELP